MNRRALLALPIVAAIGSALAWAGSQSGLRLGDWPVFALCVALAFALNALVFVPSWLARSERYYDATGSATYLAVIALALSLGNRTPRAGLVALLIAIWAVRLGSFLFARIREAGRDPRFDAIKVDFARFLLAFMLQGLWVALTAGAALAAMTADIPGATTAAMTPSASADAFGPIEACGILVWMIGFSIEVMADRQKRLFRQDPSQQGRFIETGLWARSRHPNYFGEIVLWIGIAILAWPALRGPALATLVSPVFVYVLLTRISGIPLLEARAERRWGKDPDYLAYVARTPLLVPRVFS